MASTDHGSARWMNDNEIEEAGMFKPDGLTVGHRYINQLELKAIRYTGEQHLITIAPNRTGKGTCAIIPNLLDYRGGVFVIDPKGENAIVTASTRRRMGQSVQILDPWGIAVDRLRDDCGFDGSTPDLAPFDRAAFNPLDMLKADSPDLTDDAQMIADALVVDEQGENSHWSTEAKSALAGFIMHVVTSPNEEGQRHLPRVRDILSLPPADMEDLIRGMAKSEFHNVRKAANRLMQKTEKELQSVMSSANANTHFLDSDAVRASLTHSSFDFGQLKDNDAPLSVYLVLPADRLDTHGRWLRLLVSMALTAVSRRKGKPKLSALFILDEFAALGRLGKVEQAFGLMAGFGMRIWAILQDLSQLQDLYQKRWQTFLANAGVLQILGANDLLTAEYVSRLLGRETLETVSQSTMDKRNGGFWQEADPNYKSMSDREFGRDLMTPDEVMKMHPRQSLLFITNQNPIKAVKWPYYRNARYFDWDEDYNFPPTYTEHPDQPPHGSEGHPIICDEETKQRIDEFERKLEAIANEGKPEKPKRKKLFGLF
ncbi:type IV secretory system conjugative DNA transfer family protein [Paracoccus sp. T5]